MGVNGGNTYEITGLILTYNEEANIRRTLNQLTWLPEILVVDSYSTDQTVSICEEFDNVVVHQRGFDTHTDQWNFGLKICRQRTEWLLALDADYYVTGKLVREIQNWLSQEEIPYNGFWVNFKYAIEGEVIDSGIYPPVQILYRPGKAVYVKEGHTQRIKVEGRSGRFENEVIHDDRKSFDRWLINQNQYARLEAAYLLNLKDKECLPGKQDRLRVRSKFTPFLMFLYCILARSGWRDGKAGWLYAFQRLIAEVLLQYHMILNRLKKD